MKKIILILSISLFSCNYPNINEIPDDIDLSITIEDIKNIKKLKDEINE